MRAARPTFVLACVLLFACGGDSDPPGPYDDLEVSFDVPSDGLSSPVDVVRDEFGVPHVYARTVADLAFAHGYVMAADRVQQMDLFRHFASGTVGELYGALDQELIDTDIEMRMHRMRPVAQEAWDELSASTDPADVEIAEFLTRFADGVNAYIADLAAGERTLDPAVLVWFDPERVEPWSPVDSLVIGRLQAWSLSFNDNELDETDALQAAAEAFDDSTDPDRSARAGAYFDLFPFPPMDLTATIDGVPGVTAAAPAIPAIERPSVPRELLRRARNALRPKYLSNVQLRDARNGSNNWVLGPSRAGGATLLANDPHLSLASPSIFYAVHLTVVDELDVAGITFPGIPGVILGHNQNVAWGATTANHDVTDYYLEDIVPCTAGGGDCVMFEGGEVAIESWTEEIGIGALGTATDTLTVTYELVPHHGPLVPDIVDHDVVPRTGNQAISVRYTGHEVTHELRAIYGVWRATDVSEAMAAYQHFGFGAQNWVFADDQGNIGWTTHALVPYRTDGCFTFDEQTNPGGTAPWWVLPGDGSCEWDGWMDAQHIPQAMNPASGFLATANADPVGSIADGDPLNAPRSSDGHLLYIGARDYAEGWRIGRITRRIEALDGTAATAEDMVAIQADTYSNFGSAMTPHVLAAAAALETELATPGTHPDLETWVAGLDSAQIARLRAAAALLEGWTFETPAALVGAPDAATIDDSAATVVFNAWAVFFLRLAFDDEASAIDVGPARPAAGYALFERTGSLHTGVSGDTGEALLCDDLDTPAETESCTLLVLVALDTALDWARGSFGFGTDDMTAWRWGEVHRLTLETLIAADELNVPPPNDPNPDLRAGYPRPGDPFSVDASSPGYGDTDFTYNHGPAMRHVTVFDGDGPQSRLALPGGEVFDRASAHFRDLMDEYWYTNDYFELPWTTQQIIAGAEERWRFD